MGWRVPTANPRRAPYVGAVTDALDARDRILGSRMGGSAVDALHDGGAGRQ